MPFSEKIKLEAKRRSGFRCCLCQRIFVEVHHLIPESEGGSSVIENAATLCSGCHDLYGGNPEKRKQIRQMRDYWWDFIQSWRDKVLSQKDLGLLIPIDEAPNNINVLKKKAIAIYHRVYEYEGFDESAKILFDLVKQCQDQFPNQKRVLFLDIDGHRNKQGGYDHDMFELQRHYILGFLLPFLSEIYIPLIAVKSNKLQRNDLPEILGVFNSKEEMVEFKNKFSGSAKLRYYCSDDDRIKEV